MLPIIPLAIAFGLGCAFASSEEGKRTIEEAKKTYNRGRVIVDNFRNTGNINIPGVTPNASIKRVSPESRAEMDVKESLDASLTDVLKAGELSDDVFARISRVLTKYQAVKGMASTEWGVVLCRDEDKAKLSLSAEVDGNTIRISSKFRVVGTEVLDSVLPLKEGKSKAYKEL